MKTAYREGAIESYLWTNVYPHFDIFPKSAFDEIDFSDYFEKNVKPSDMV